MSRVRAQNAGRDRSRAPSVSPKTPRCRARAWAVLLSGAVLISLGPGCDTIAIHRFLEATGTTVSVEKTFGQLIEVSPSKVAHYTEVQLATDAVLRAPSTGAIKFVSDLEGIPNCLVLRPKARSSGIDEDELDDHLPEPAELRIALGNLERGGTLKAAIVALEKSLRPDLTDAQADSEADLFLGVDPANPPEEENWPQLAVWADPEVTEDSKTWTLLGQADGDRLQLAAYEWKDENDNDKEEAGERNFVNPAPYLALITAADFSMSLRTPEIGAIQLETADDGTFSTNVQSFDFPDLTTGVMVPNTVLEGFLRVFFRLKSGPIDGGDDVVAPWDVSYELRQIDSGSVVRSHGRFRFNTWPTFEAVDVASQRLGDALYRTSGVPTSDPADASQVLWMYLPFDLSDVDSTPGDKPINDIAVRSIFHQSLGLSTLDSTGQFLVPEGQYELDITVSDPFNEIEDTQTCRFSLKPPTIVEIEINRTATPDDDYVTWAPTFCRVRLTESPGLDQTVVLTNDSAGAAGELQFRAMSTPWPRNTTADQDTLTLILPDDQSWVEFVVAGKFGSPSERDKDAVILARADTASGRVLGTHELMVRVRKDANKLTTDERDRFLTALDSLNTAGGFSTFNDIHSVASTAQDEAHSADLAQPAFAPWHRALILQFERELQKIDPSVTLPYWNWDAAADRVFDDEFMGEGDLSGAWVAEPVFALTNPINGFPTGLLSAGGRISRRTFNQKAAPTGFLAHSVLLAEADYGPAGHWPTATTNSFSLRLERDTHNPAHNLELRWRTTHRDPDGGRPAILSSARAGRSPVGSVAAASRSFRKRRGGRTDFHGA